MPRAPEPVHVLLLVAIAVQVFVPCTAQDASDQKPLVSRLTKDYNTSLYTISIKNGAPPLVVDLAGTLVWSTCPSMHTTVPCQSAACDAVNRQQPRRCRYVDGGWFWAGREAGSRCACTAHPFNPVTGECSTGDLTSFAMSANTTNGTDLLYPESFTAVGACAPERLLESSSLPQAAAGVAGFSGTTPLSLPSQLAAQRRFGNKFALCLPVFATFGDTPVYLPNYNPYGPFDYTKMLGQTPFLTNPRRNGGYYLPVKRISVSWRGPNVPASLPAGALDLDVRTGRGGVVLSTTTPYAIMRPDVFRAFAKAFDTVVVRDTESRMVRVAGQKQLELCYGGAGDTVLSFPMMKRAGYDAPAITLELAGATGNWTILNGNYLVRETCVGVVEMGPEGMPVDGEPAVVIGGMQLENILMVFDLDKRTLGFSRLLEWDLTNCYSATMFRLSEILIHNMANPPIKCLLPPAIVSLVLLLSCMVGVATGDGEQPPYKPLVVPLVRDSDTSFYTIPIKNGAPLVVDLAGTLVWSTCPSTHTTVSCLSGACSAANQQQPRRCRYVDGGWFWSGREPGSHCACTAHPFNPVTGECSTGDLTPFAMSANSTVNGTRLLHPEEFAAVGSCAPQRLLASLPAGATGIAGFSRRPLSLPSQLSAQRNFGNKFALCMSQFVVFGDAPVYLGMEGRGFVDYREILPYTPLLTNPRIPGYYLPVKGISVSWSEPGTPVSLPAGALDMDTRTGRGGVVLSTTTPYTVMRPDVFRAFAEAFDTAIIKRSKYTYSNVTRHPAVGPFKLCYNGAFPMRKRPASMDIPTIHLELDGATGTWSWFNDNYLVFAPGALCVGVLEMEAGGMPVDGQPAMVVGVMQLDWNLLVFDLDKMLMWFSGDLAFRLAGCSYSSQIGCLIPPAIASLVLVLLPCLVATGDQRSQQRTSLPLIVPLVRDTTTSLYTISIKKDDAPLVVDLAGTLVWSTCPSTHTTVSCLSGACSAANQQQPRRCRYVDGGWFWSGREPGSHCACTAHPFNPVTRECSTGDLTTFAMSANSTVNGTRLLHPEEFAALTGQRNFGSKFALCLSGFAAFGDTPVYIGMEGRGLVNYTEILPYTPLLTNPRNPGYYLPASP
uniref:Peptidase A1 domain-containing protein n=1 Tax=Oryza punctata TaxID=4537 RepID=A0A0E0JTE9_ORYPU